MTLLQPGTPEPAANEARIRRTMSDLKLPEAAPRLNAQVRLREEHVEMIQFLLDRLFRTRQEVSQLRAELEKERPEVAGENYTFPMPTEKLRTELDETRRQLEQALRALESASAERCPDPQCLNCRKWKDWEDRHGDVLWLQCPSCEAPQGMPCRHRGEGRGGTNGAPVLKRPHRDRPWVERPQEDVV